MLYLHQYPGIWGLSSLSPFCVKVETYLQMANLPYHIITENNPRKGPKGKMPVLKDGNLVIPDSTFIIEYLKQKFGDTLDRDLSEKDRAISLAVQRMIEENLYFVILYSRWIDPAGKNIIDKAFRQFFPKILAPLVLMWIRSNLKKQAYTQGLGRHTRDEIYQIGLRDINAIAALLGDNKFILGDKPHSIDATVYAFLITILKTPLKNPLQDCVLSHKNLTRYCETVTLAAQNYSQPHELVV